MRPPWDSSCLKCLHIHQHQNTGQISQRGGFASKRPHIPHPLDMLNINSCCFTHLPQPTPSHLGVIQLHLVVLTSHLTESFRSSKLGPRFAKECRRRSSCIVSVICKVELLAGVVLLVLTCTLTCGGIYRSETHRRKK